MKKIYSIVFIVIFSILTHSLYALEGNGMQFVENKKQWDQPLLFKADIHLGHIFFFQNKMQYMYFNGKDLEKVHDMKHENYFEAYNVPINCYAYNVKFINSLALTQVSGNNKQSHYHNYFLGNKPERWSGNVPVYSDLQYKNLYKNIDMHCYSNEGNFKYDLIVAPNANVNDIVFEYEGVTPKLLDNGNLLMDIGFNKIQESAPYCYQIIDGKKVEVACKYQLNNKKELRFVFPKGYRKDITLVIDPTLVFATYSGSTATTYGFSATYDNNGSLYAGGECFGVGWAFTPGAFQTVYGGGVDAGINKYTPNGNSVVYSTYYGGSGGDLPNNMVVNNNGELAMFGSTTSTNLPVTPGCYDNTLGGSADAYIVRFNVAGSAMVGATYVGGSGVDAQNNFALSPNYGDGARGEIFFDTNNDIVITGSTSSTDFPISASAYQTANGGAQDGFLFKINGMCTNMIFSTYIGGVSDDASFSISKNSAGNWVICGGTASANFPTTAGAMTTTQPGGTDAFVSILSNNGTTLLYSTYIGTSSFDHAFKVQVDNNDTVYVCGQTNGANFPVSPGVYSNPNSTIFIQKLSPTLNAMILSTLIGQTTNLVPTAFLKDNCGNVYFSGFQANAGLPVTPNAFQAAQGGFWLAVLTGDFTQLVYATYMGIPGDHVDGGTSRFDPLGKIYHSVCTSSTNQYQSPGCYQPIKLAGGWDVASFKFDFELSGVTADFNINPNDSGCAPYTVVFTNNSQLGLNFLWDFGDGNTSNLASPTHTFMNAGTYNVMLVAFNQNSCIPTDTAYTTIKVIAGVDASFSKKVILDCIDDTVYFSLTDSSQNAQFFWTFGDGAFSSQKDPKHTYYTQGIYTITCIATNGFCHDTFQDVVNLLHPIEAVFGILDSVCLGSQVVATSNSVPNYPGTHYWDFGDGTQFAGTQIASHTYTKAGNYIVTLIITDTLGCKDTFTHPVFVEDLPYVHFTTSDSLVCTGDPVYFDDSVAAHTVWYEWDMGDGTKYINKNDIIYSWQNGGVYNVTLTGHYLKCPDVSFSKTITVNDYPIVNLGNDTSICPGVTGSILLADNNNPNAIHLWSTGETSASIVVTTPGRYWVKASNGSCNIIDSIWIKRDCYINIPNSFSPNGDGLNEYFLPREILSSGLKSFKMDIFNRWGEHIFTASTVDGRGWDGKYNGVAQPVGVYVYVIDVEFENGIKKTYKGNVTLMR